MENNQIKLEYRRQLLDLLKNIYVKQPESQNMSFQSQRLLERNE